MSQYRTMILGVTVAVTACVTYVITAIWAPQALESYGMVRDLLALTLTGGVVKSIMQGKAKGA